MLKQPAIWLKLVLNSDLKFKEQFEITEVYKPFEQIDLRNLNTCFKAPRTVKYYKKSTYKIIYRLHVQLFINLFNVNNLNLASCTRVAIELMQRIDGIESIEN